MTKKNILDPREFAFTTSAPDIKHIVVKTLKLYKQFLQIANSNTTIRLDKSITARYELWFSDGLVKSYMCDCVELPSNCEVCKGCGNIH